MSAVTPNIEDSVAGTVPSPRGTFDIKVYKAIRNDEVAFNTGPQPPLQGQLVVLMASLFATTGMPLALSVFLKTMLW